MKRPVSSAATLARLLSQWQHPSSTRLQGLDLIHLSRRTIDPLEELRIHDALESGCVNLKSEIVQYDAEIEELEQRLHALRERRSILQHCVQGCTFLSTSLKAPMHKLPDDVMVTIFEMACTNPLGILLIGKPEPEQQREPRYDLASVCYRWRTLVMRTPSLWTDVHVMCGNPHGSQLLAEVQLQALKKVILRSKNCPLRIKLDCYHLNEYQTFWSSVLAFLEPHLVARCQSLTFLESASPFAAHQLPWSSLRSLCIRDQYDPRSRGKKSQTFNVQLPVLQSLLLEVCPSRLEFQLGAEWRILTRFEAKDWGLHELQELLPILSQCINLEELEISASRNNYPDRVMAQVPQTLHSLPSLRILSLQLRWCEADIHLHHLKILQTLHMPSLQSLQLDLDYTFDVQRFLETLLYCPLASLAISIATDNLPGLRTLLLHFHSLKTLSLQVAASQNIDSQNLDDADTHIWQPLKNFLLKLKVKAGAEGSDLVLLPQLSEFEFEMWVPNSVKTKNSWRKALIDMVHSRHEPPHGVSRLQSVDIYMSGRRQEQYETIRELKDLDGLKVTSRGSIFRR